MFSHPENQPSLFDGIVSNTTQQRVIPEPATEILHQDTENAGIVRLDASSIEHDLNILEDPIQTISSSHQERLLQLREHHRVLSDMVVNVNRELARIVTQSGHENTQKAKSLSGQSAHLQEQRTHIESEIKDELRAIKALERRLSGTQHHGKRRTCQNSTSKPGLFSCRLIRLCPQRRWRKHGSADFYPQYQTRPKHMGVE